MNDETESPQEYEEQRESRGCASAFDTTPLILSLQVLPQSSDELDRRVILSAGIKGEPPLFLSCQLAELLTGTPLQHLLQQLEQALPQMIAARTLREQAQQQAPQTPTRPIISSPSLPEKSPQTSTQITLF